MPIETLNPGIVFTIPAATPYAVPPGPHRILFSTASASYSATYGGVYTALTNPNVEPGVLLESGFVRNDAGGNRLVIVKKVTRLGTYPGQVALMNPTVFYTLNEKSGTTLFDGLGQNNLTKGAAAVLGQTSPFASGETGMLLDGTINSVASVASISPWTGATAITFEAWVNNAAFAVGHEVILSLGSVGHYLSFETGRLFMSLHISGVQRTNQTVAAQSAGSLLHVVGTWTTGEALTLYINGILQTGVTDTTVRSGSLSAAAGFHIGAFGGTSLFYSGLLYGVAVYLRRLSSDEIAQHYSARNNRV